VGIREFPCRAWGRGDIRGGEAGGVEDLDVQGDCVEYGMGFWGDGGDGGYAGCGEVDGWCLGGWGVSEKSEDAKVEDLLRMPSFLIIDMEGILVIELLEESQKPMHASIPK